jgi:hypothetical protein
MTFIKRWEGSKTKSWRENYPIMKRYRRNRKWRRDRRQMRRWPRGSFHRLRGRISLGTRISMEETRRKKKRWTSKL